MAVSAFLTPVAAFFEIVTCVLALVIGFSSRKIYGWLFAFTFFIFAAFDVLGGMSIPSDLLAILNLIAVLAGLCGMYLLLRENCPRCKTGNA